MAVALSLVGPNLDHGDAKFSSPLLGSKRLQRWWFRRSLKLRDFVYADALASWDCLQDWTAFWQDERLPESLLSPEAVLPVSRLIRDHLPQVNSFPNLNNKNCRKKNIKESSKKFYCEGSEICCFSCQLAGIGKRAGNNQSCMRQKEVR
jgi:hypothetical protein